MNDVDGFNMTPYNYYFLCMIQYKICFNNIYEFVSRYLYINLKSIYFLQYYYNINQ
jgi:hypothetical protein